MMCRIIYSMFAVSMLDAVTTYIIIASGRGVEANPFMQFLNYAPEAVFFVQLFGVLAMASLLKIIEATTAALPAALKIRIYKVVFIAFITAVVYRAAVVVNNTLGIVVGITPLADVLYA